MHLAIVLQDGEEPEFSLISGGLVSGKQSSQEKEGKQQYLCVEACMVYSQLILTICIIIIIGGSSSAVVQRSKMEVALEGSAGMWCIDM